MGELKHLLDLAPREAFSPLVRALWGQHLSHVTWSVCVLLINTLIMNVLFKEPVKDTLTHWLSYDYLFSC